jgi:hypothetical protein
LRSEHRPELRTAITAAWQKADLGVEVVADLGIPG